MWPVFFFFSFVLYKFIKTTLYLKTNTFEFNVVPRVCTAAGRVARLAAVNVRVGLA